MSKPFRYVLIAFLIVGLVLVRKYETVLFYDPFLQYFRGKTGRLHYPEYDFAKLIGNVFFRYSLNTVLSLFIIGLVFREMRYVRFSAYVYLIFLLLLLPLYGYLVIHYFEMGDNIGFYIRRLLIQPMLLLLLLPAFAAYKPRNMRSGDK